MTAAILKEIEDLARALRDEKFDEDGRRLTDKTHVALNINSRQLLAIRLLNLLEQLG